MTVSGSYINSYKLMNRYKIHQLHTDTGLPTSHLHLFFSLDNKLLEIPLHFFIHNGPAFVKLYNLSNLKSRHRLKMVLAFLEVFPKCCAFHFRVTCLASQSKAEFV